MKDVGLSFVVIGYSRSLTWLSRHRLPLNPSIRPSSPSFVRLLLLHLSLSLSLSLIIVTGGHSWHCLLSHPSILSLADRTNGRDYATVLRPSVCLSVVCFVCIVAKRCVLPNNCLQRQIGNGLLGIEWSRDR